MINLDHNATTPLVEPVRQAIERAARDFPGNPSSPHGLGRAARAELERARARLAAALGAPSPAGLVWCSSGSEANNLAIKGLLLPAARRRAAADQPPPHVLATRLEHPCVLRSLQAAGWMIPGLKVELHDPMPDGRVDLERLLAAITPDTELVILQLVNHETGVVQPVAELVAALRVPERAQRPAVMCDAIQAPGRLPFHIGHLGVDLLSVAAHKFGGPRGMAALWARPALDLDPLVNGGPQEAGRRAGTENLPGAVGMALAAELAMAATEPQRDHLARLEQAFRATLASEGLDYTINGRVDEKLPGVLNLTLRGLGREDLVVGLDVEQVAVAAGSACASGAIQRAPVLSAMRIEDWRVEGAIRISFGAENTLEEAREAAACLARLARRLRAAGATLTEEGSA